MEPIIAYSAYWHTESDTGRLFLKLHSEEVVQLEIDSPAELEALCSMLRSYPHMVFDPKEKLISTTWQRPGPVH